ncbi:transposase [Pseudoalteromonas sp. JC3]|uniref:transposase n=1 Tax=Pseudoalteromonas sp. JC3 TaxID=2810196 RepID=UPI0019D05956|nr:transposase [Pseudoalteromonas sp. JC3]MBR8841834.1 IS110 family transposase [Pseudoalteromonas sp. JC3]WJE11169.1 transposase [Pseudoalteromonas sp. JC3]
MVSQSITNYDKNLECVVSGVNECKKPMKLEGIGILGAINLYNLLGNGEQLTFKTGREASACIGLTPIQHSSGGQVKIGSIGRFVRNTAVRSYLIVGAMSAINQIMIRPAKTKKELWIKQLVDRKGKRCAAVALANKNVRTVFAMLTQDTNYTLQPLTA